MENICQNISVSRKGKAELWFYLLKVFNFKSKLIEVFLVLTRHEEYGYVEFWRKEYEI